MGIFRKIAAFFTGAEIIDDDLYDEIEENLVMADVGVNTAGKIIASLKQKVKEKKIYKPEDCKNLLMDSIREQMNVPDDAYDFEKGPSVVLMIGVNGVGKTSSVGKLAASLKNNGKKVLICAADTFRAAAIDQLGEWAKRAGVDMISQNEGSDPAAVVFDALNAAKARKADVLLVDTAGRLQNKKNLMDELNKIDRVISREFPEAKRETLVVLDGTTGQNALVQAREFNEVAPVSGIIITKLEGTAKGGIAIAVQSELSVPVKYIGLGEKIDSLKKFDPDEYVKSLFENKKSCKIYKNGMFFSTSHFCFCPCIPLAVLRRFMYQSHE
ncbi:MAG: signal recognition particle-docking protein FtsY [Lachnospiraceae bacterium]|nr:signal recognition particle-docking protein FtsY [Lachnospiraceae bacterium]